MQVFRLNEVTPDQVTRFPVGFDELDWAYGRPHEWGVPMGRISLWSGEKGVGKTRLLSQLMKVWDERGWTSLIFQGEVSPAQFASEKMRGYTSDRILISQDVSIDEQIRAIATYRPHFVITDSVQQIEEYRGGRGAKEIVRKLRALLELTQTHVIFISQLTAAGTTRGGTELPHEVDVEVYVKRWAPKTCPDLFYMEIMKNRYGRSGKEVVFCHKDWGVECQSQHRMKDADWVRDHSPAVLPRKKLFGIF